MSELKGATSRNPVPLTASAATLALNEKQLGDAKVFRFSSLTFRFRGGLLVMLNPTFGEASALVGGADADLIVGDMLVEVKTEQEGCIERDEMRQLIGYVTLARTQTSSAVPLSAVAVYCSRFGVLERVPLPQHLDDRACQSAARRLAQLWQRRAAA